MAIEEPGRPLRVSGWLAEGVTRSRLRSASWAHPHYGVARRGQDAPSTPWTRIWDAMALAAPGCALGGWGSAYVQGVTYLDGRDRWGRDIPVTLVMDDGHQIRARTGIRCPRPLLLPGELVQHGDVMVTSLARTAFDLMCQAPNLTEAVVAVDMITSMVMPPRACTLTEVADLVTAHRKTKGIRQARRALELASDRSRSPWESRVRVLAHLDAGLTGLLVNVPMFSPSGSLLGIPDLLDPMTGLVIETDGGDHREARRHSDDNRREEEFEDVSCTVTRVTPLDLRREVDVVGRMNAAARRARRTVQTSGWTLQIPTWWYGHPLSITWNWPPRLDECAELVG